MTTTPVDHFQRIQTSALYPPFLDLLKQLVLNCEARGARFYVISGLRTFQEQAALYAQGRTKKPGKIVTKARAGQSAHNYGIAADLCRDADMQRDGLQPDWDLESYRLMAEEAVKLGLEAAFYWTSFKEGPHVQLNLASKKLSLDMLCDAYLKGKQAAVVDLLNKHSW